METQQQQSVEENPLLRLTTEELGDRLAGAKQAIKTSEDYYEELKAEMLTRLGRGEVLYVKAPEVQVGDERVQPIAAVSIRHKSRTTTKVHEERAIRYLRADHPKHANLYIQKTEVPAVPAHTEEVLDKAAFLKATGEGGTLTDLRVHVTVKESDWIEVTGLPK